MISIIQKLIEAIAQILLSIINLPLRLLVGIGIIVLLIFKREVPSQLWELVSPPQQTRVIPLRRQD